MSDIDKVTAARQWADMYSRWCDTMEIRRGDVIKARDLVVARRYNLKEAYAPLRSMLQCLEAWGFVYHPNLPAQLDVFPKDDDAVIWVFTDVATGQGAIP